MQNGIGESDLPAKSIQGIAPLTEFIPKEDPPTEIVQKEPEMMPPPDVHLDEGWEQEIPPQEESHDIPEELDDDCLRIRFIKDVEQPVMDFDGNEVQPLIGDVFVFPEVLAKAMIKMGYAEDASI